MLLRTINMAVPWDCRLIRCTGSDSYVAGNLKLEVTIPRNELRGIMTRGGSRVGASADGGGVGNDQKWMSSARHFNQSLFQLLCPKYFLTFLLLLEQELSSLLKHKSNLHLLHLLISR